MTVSFGTTELLTTFTSFAPARMMPDCSACLPTMKPCTSWNKISGSPVWLQSITNRAALSAALTSSAPPRNLGWLATMPAARPPNRAKPVTRFFAQSGFIQSTSPSSTTAVTTLRTSYARRGAVGTMS